MIPASILDNVVPWLLQVLVIGSLGAVLPLIFRIRHPRSQLIYCHLLLAACFALPFIQQWRHPVLTAELGMAAADAPVIVSTKTPTGASASATPISWHQILAFVLLAGVVIRLFWTLAGLWELRHYRKSAEPLYALPEAVRTARSIVKADAGFFTSAGAGPLTFGFFRRVILFPESYLELDSPAQLGIACHELIHVRRNDWLVTLLEEFAASLFWFHPGIWWVLGQARLAREQLVDAEVVHLTSAREPYINALLKIAGARPPLDLAPAPLFLRKRHLFQRMHFLLSEVSMSRFRLFSSYGSMAAILAVAGWVAFVSFPLIGKAEIIPAVRPSASQAPQSEPGYVVNAPPVYYPPAALQKGIQGSVVVELTFNASGDVTDSRVLSGPEELRKAGLESALRGTYNVKTARTLQVVVNFVPAPPMPPPVTPPAPGQRGGGPRGGAAPQAVVAPPPIPGLNLGAILETINIAGLQGSELAQMQQRLQVFQNRQVSQDLIKEINDAIGAAGLSGQLRGTSFAETANNNTALLLTFGTAAFRIRVGGAVAQGNLIKPAVDPVYPPLAKAANIQGNVVLEVNISRDGKVENANVITGHPLLVQAAVAAVKQWEYMPTMLNGAPVDVITTVTVSFSLQQ